MVPIVKKAFDIGQHVLVPEHKKMSQKEKEQLLDDFKVTVKDLPRISIRDPAISHLDVEPNDVIKINRLSLTAKTTTFYRRVVK